MDKNPKLEKCEEVEESWKKQKEGRRFVNEGKRKELHWQRGRWVNCRTRAGESRSRGHNVGKH